jgi:hypothetical protein
MGVIDRAARALRNRYMRDPAGPGTIARKPNRPLLKDTP